MRDRDYGVGDSSGIGDFYRGRKYDFGNTRHRMGYGPSGDGCYDDDEKNNLDEDPKKPSKEDGSMKAFWIVLIAGYLIFGALVFLVFN